MSETSNATDSESEEQADDVPAVEARPPATRQAIMVVLAIGAIAALIVIQFAFSTANDNQSVDGTTATSSQYVGG